MGQILGKVFNVRRVPKTAKSITVGDFKALEQAEYAMVEHFKANSKRGNFFYTISEDELEDMNGIVFRKTIIALSGAGSYYKKYTMDELKQM